MRLTRLSGNPAAVRQLTFWPKVHRAKLFHLPQPPTLWPVVLDGRLDRCKPWWTSGKILLGTKFVPGNHDGPRVEKVSEIQDWSGKNHSPHCTFFSFLKLCFLWPRRPLPILCIFVPSASKALRLPVCVGTASTL